MDSLLGEMGVYGSSLAKARFIHVHIAQPCMHPAAANRHKGGRRSRHRTKNRAFSATALPSREGGTPERASPLEGQGCKPWGGARRSGEHDP